MIPQEGGNRFSGAAGYSYRPGAWQGDNLTDRLIDAGLTAGNSTEYITDLTDLAGRSDHEGQALVLRRRDATTAPATASRTRSSTTARRATDYNYIRDGLGPCHLSAGRRSTRSRGLLRPDQQVPRARHAELDGSRNGVDGLDLAELLDTAGIKYTSTLTSRILLEGGCGDEHRAPRRRPCRTASTCARDTPAWFAECVAHDTAPPRSARARSAPSSAGSRSGRSATATAARCPTSRGSHHIKAGAQMARRASSSIRTHANARPDAALHRTWTPRIGRQRRPILGFSGPIDVVLRNTPVQSQETAEPRPRHLRAGLVHAEAPDAERRHPLGISQLAASTT